MKPPKDLDQQFHVAHNAAFERTDCLDCGNCCKTTSPVFKRRDITRIAKSLRMKISAFSAQYLRMDEEGDWVLQTAPCPFLQLDDNTCGIYDHRPQACNEYPHTNRKSMSGVLNLTEQNAQICPAVSRIIQGFMKAAEVQK